MEGKKNWYGLGRERKGLRNDVREASGVSAHEFRTISPEARDTITDAEFADAVAGGKLAEVAGKTVVDSGVSENLARIGEITEAAKEFSWRDAGDRQIYQEERNAAHAEAEREAGGAEKEIKKQSVFRELDTMTLYLRKLKRDEYAASRHQNDPKLADTLRRNAALEDALWARKAALEADPATRLFVREHELERYNRELDKDRFVETPSRRAYIDRIEELIRHGKPVLLEGHTGTGKSELARIAARELTGSDPEVVYCNPQTRPSDIFGKQSLKETERGATVTDVDYGPLVRAVTNGRFVIFDEFNELDPRFRQTLKWLYNARPGDEVDIPGNGKVKIAEGFGFMMTANLKSEKYTEKGELEPQEARVFQDSTIRVEYPPADELYDIALSALSDERGDVMLARAEAETVLKEFTDAVADIQASFGKSLPGAYGNNEAFAGMTRGRAKRPKLEKYVLDTGMMARLLQGFHIARMKRGVALRDFINASLARTFEGDRVSEGDKKLAVFILATKGFLGNLRDNPALLERLGLDYADGALSLTSVEAANDLALPSALRRTTLSAEEVASLDPYGVRKTSVTDAASEFDLPPPPEAAGAASGERSFAEARERFKENFLGSEAIEAAFGFRPDAKDIPPIPFSTQELTEAAKRGETLILNWDRLHDGTPLTLETMAERAIANLPGKSNVIEKNPDGSPKRYLLYKDQFDEKGKLLPGAWFAKDRHMTTTTPERGWQLVSPDIIQGSVSKNYIDQTDFLIAHLERTFPGGAFPAGSIEAAAKEEWMRERSKAAKLIADGHWQDASNTLAALAVSRLFREPVGNTIFRYLLAYKNGTHLFTDGMYSWSNTVASDGFLASFGNAGARGAGVGRSGPDGAWSNCGVVFSRRKL